jgi:hypothetical protein
VGKRWTSEVGDGKYRLSYMDGQLIGIEIWPHEEGVHDGRYLVFKFEYQRPRAKRRLLGLRRDR